MSSKKADSLRIEDIQRLNVDCIKETPVSCDWQELGYDNFDVIQPFSMDDQRFKDEAEEYGSDPEDAYYEACDSNYPMMNYYYPLPERDEFDHEDAEKIQHLNLCLVYLVNDERYALALTGGGMDLSWDIVEAHIRLGFYPPTHFRLPRMAGMSNTLHKRVIVNACIKSREVLKNWCDSDISDLNRVTKWLIKNSEVEE